MAFPAKTTLYWNTKNNFDLNPNHNPNHYTDSSFLDIHLSIAGDFSHSRHQHNQTMVVNKANAEVED